jgi:hypothetical protein
MDIFAAHPTMSSGRKFLSGSQKRKEKAKKEEKEKKELAYMRNISLFFTEKDEPVSNTKCSSNKPNASDFAYSPPWCRYRS